MRPSAKQIWITLGYVLAMVVIKVALLTTVSLVLMLDVPRLLLYIFVGFPLFMLLAVVFDLTQLYCAAMDEARHAEPE